MEYERNIYQTINPVATLDLCGAGNFRNGVHIDIGAGIFSTWGQEFFQGRALAEAHLGERPNFGIALWVSVNLNHLVSLNAGARCIIRRSCRSVFERTNRGCQISTFPVRAIADINKAIGSIWNVWKLFARFRKLCQDGGKWHGCRSRTDRSCTTQSKTLSLFATFWGFLMGDRSREVTEHLNGISSGPWRTSDAGRRSRMEIRSGLHTMGGDSRWGMKSWLNDGWSNRIVFVIQRAIITCQRARRVATTAVTGWRCSRFDNPRLLLFSVVKVGQENVHASPVVVSSIIGMSFLPVGEELPGGTLDVHKLVKSSSTHLVSLKRWTSRRLDWLVGDDTNLHACCYTKESPLDVGFDEVSRMGCVTCEGRHIGLVGG